LAVIDSKNFYTLYYNDIQNFVKYNKQVVGRSINIKEWIKAKKEVDLYVRDNDDDIGDEPNNSTSNFWQTTSIWVRHIDDGQLTHQNPVSGTVNWVYVRVENIGYSASRGDEKLYLHWAKAGLTLMWDYSWTGNHFPQGPLIGNYIDSLPIPSLAPGASAIVKFRWNVPDANDYANFGFNTDQWHFCLLARIVAKNDPMTHSELIAMSYNVINNNNIAQKNVSLVNPAKGVINGVIFVGNFCEAMPPFCLKFTPESGSATLWHEAEIRVKLNDALFAAWARGGFQGNQIERIEDKTLIIRGENASLCNLIFEPNEVGLLDVQFNFLTKEITSQENYTFHVIQTGAEEDDVVGGEVYQIIKSLNRKLFYADAGEDIYAFQEEAITLTAKNIGEPAQYKWYDQDGNLVGEGMVFTTVAREEQQYRLEVTALSDGYKDYDEVWVRIVPGKIESIQPNPARDRVTVTCVYNNVSEARIVISDQFGKIYAEYPLGTSFIGDLPVSRGPQSVDFDVFRYTPGTYIVTLVCDGQVSDNKTFVKE